MNVSGLQPYFGKDLVGVDLFGIKDHHGRYEHMLTMTYDKAFYLYSSVLASLRPCVLIGSLIPDS